MGTGQQLRHKRPLIFTNPQAIAFRAGHAYPAQEPPGPGEYVTMNEPCTAGDVTPPKRKLSMVPVCWQFCRCGKPHGKKEHYATCDECLAKQGTKRAGER